MVFYVLSQFADAPNRPQYIDCQRNYLYSNYWQDRTDFDKFRFFEVPSPIPKVVDNRKGIGSNMSEKPTYEELETRIQLLEQTEKALIESEQKWRNILVNIPQIGIALDSQARIVFANAHFLELTDWKAQEIIGQDWFDLFIPENIREEVRKIFITVMGQHDTLGFSTYENQIVTRSGDLRDVAWSNVLTKDAQGNVLDVTCLGIDLTERNQLEASLRESEERFRTLVEKSPLGISLIANDGRYKYFNPQFSTIFGYFFFFFPQEKPGSKKLIRVRNIAKK